MTPKETMGEINLLVSQYNALSQAQFGPEKGREFLKLLTSKCKLMDRLIDLSSMYIQTNMTSDLKPVERRLLDLRNL